MAWRDRPQTELEIWSGLKIATREERKSVRYLLRVYQPWRTQCWLRMYYKLDEDSEVPVTYMWHHFRSTFQQWFRRYPPLDALAFTACVTKTFGLQPVEVKPLRPVFIGLERVFDEPVMSAREADRQRRVAEVEQLQRKGFVPKTPPRPLNAFQAKLAANPRVPWPLEAPTYADLYDEKYREIFTTSMGTLHAQPGDWWREVEIQAKAAARADIEDFLDRRDREEDAHRMNDTDTKLAVVNALSARVLATLGAAAVVSSRDRKPRSQPEGSKDAKAGTGAKASKDAKASKSAKAGDAAVRKEEATQEEASQDGKTVPVSSKKKGKQPARR